MIRVKNIVLIIGVVLVNLSGAFSQKKAEMINTRWANNVVVADGSLSDWPDSLTMFNEATNLYYSLANDDKNVYLALRSASKQDLTKILAGGISFSANIEGKKKDPATVIFPVLDRTPGKSRNTKDQPEVEEMQKQILSRIKDIKVAGFKEIIDGGISLQNTYGIRAAAGFDKNNNLIQEIIIPLSLLNLSTANAGEVTYSIKVNGLQGASVNMNQRQTAQRQPMGGMYGGQFPPRNSAMNKLLTSTEFYIRSRLATKQ
ncbi:hypothetical protein [Daejeonella lutea]|uniref:Uncharacterized protein n=1 Tax=Daejeonella lutea TaxID=572036 RepID=A0A1T5DR09_9SPHI|nr:hypothetical protein [Daejeonella lutea]SKB74085.1 hypothetical protein SAMN05661099_2528 [Daejeonella lutea]